MLSWLTVQSLVSKALTIIQLFCCCLFFSQKCSAHVQSDRSVRLVGLHLPRYLETQAGGSLTEKYGRLLAIAMRIRISHEGTWIDLNWENQKDLTCLWHPSAVVINCLGCLLKHIFFTGGSFKTAMTSNCFWIKHTQSNWQVPLSGHRCAPYRGVFQAPPNDWLSFSTAPYYQSHAETCNLSFIY